jgi:hypothetical protein
MDYKLTKARTHLSNGKKANFTNKNLKTCAQTLAEMNLNPFFEIARLAVIAEKNNDLGTASTNWRFLGEYVDAKRKAIDPAENALKQKQIMTLEQLAEVKRLIVYGKAEEEFTESIVENEFI